MAPKWIISHNFHMGVMTMIKIPGILHSFSTAITENCWHFFILVHLWYVCRLEHAKID